jgi:hypothetical protein
MVSYGEVEGNDAGSSIARDRQRNLSFRSSIADVCGTFEFNFFKYNKNNPRMASRHTSPRVLVYSSSILRLNTRANGTTCSHWAQRGRTMPATSGVKKYKLYSFEIPLEIGFKIHLKKNWNINAFMSFGKHLPTISMM